MRSHEQFGEEVGKDSEDNASRSDSAGKADNSLKMDAICASSEPPGGYVPGCGEQSVGLLGGLITSREFGFAESAWKRHYHLHRSVRGNVGRWFTP